MNNKQYILEILQELREHWTLASGLIHLIQSAEVSDKEITALIEIFENVVQETKDTSLIKKLSTSTERLRGIRIREQQERKDEKEEVDSIFNHL